MNLRHELFGIDLKPGPYKTVEGHIVERIGRIPEIGDGIEIDGHRLVVIEMDRQRIATVEATPLPTGASLQRAAE